MSSSQVSDVAGAIHDHYKTVFGVPESAHSFELGSLLLDVVVFADRPCTGARTIATAGLASVLGQELIFSCYSAQFMEETPKLVGSVARQLSESREGLRRGQVLGPAGVIQPNATVEAFYACPPTYFPESLEPLHLAAGEHVHFFWLVPLHRSEARWVVAHDDETFLFETMLERLDPDLLDLRRDSLTLV